MNECYEIKEEVINLEDSTDICRVLTIICNDCDIIITFINGKPTTKIYPK